MTRGARRPGIALIEVLTAIAILAVAGALLVELSRTAGDDIARRGSRERETIDAASILTEVSLRPAAEIARRAGTTWRRHGLDVRIETVDRRLFDVIVSDTLNGAPVLASRLYLPSDAR